MSTFWSSVVSQLNPYTPGEQPDPLPDLKLNTNENPYPPSPKVQQAITLVTDTLARYPDPGANKLKQTLADYYRVNAEQVFVGNSSDEVLAHAFFAFFQQTPPLLMPDISYSFYPSLCQLYGIRQTIVPLNDHFEVDLRQFNQANGGIVFANPNAPTGIAVNNDDIQALLKANTDSVVLIDEAYADFAQQSAISLIQHYPNLLITRTFSKSRSLAGLRVGYAIGDQTLINGLERVKNSFHPYALGSLSQQGAIAAIEDNAYFEKCRDAIIASREQSVSRFTQLGFDVLPSQANFLFVHHPEYQAKQLYQELKKKGVLVRHFQQTRINDFIRVSIGTDEQMLLFFQRLESLLQ